MLQHIPDAVIRIVLEDHLTELEAKTLRLVSKECRSCVDRNTSQSKPRDLTSSQVCVPTQSWYFCVPLTIQHGN